MMPLCHAVTERKVRFANMALKSDAGAELAPVWKKKAAERKLKAEQRKREVAERKFAVEQTKREAAQERAKYHEERLKKLKQKHDSLALWWRSIAKKTEDNAREIKRHRDRL